MAQRNFTIDGEIRSKGTKVEIASAAQLNTGTIVLGDIDGDYTMLRQGILMSDIEQELGFSLDMNSIADGQVVTFDATNSKFVGSAHVDPNILSKPYVLAKVKDAVDTYVASIPAYVYTPPAP